MQAFIEWWCRLIGISDPTAISVAVGLAAIGVIYVAAVLVLNVLNFVLVYAASE